MKRLLAIVAIACISMSVAVAQKTKPQDINPSELSFGENISMPEVKGKAVTPVRKHMDEIANTLKKHFDNVQTLRDGEVVLATVPASYLFKPNTTELKDSGKKYLRPFLAFLKYPTMYKVIVAVHSDDTGEPAYLEELTSARANAIDEFLCAEGDTEGDNLVPYGIGEDDPLGPNNSIASREANRRVEIYVVPEWQLIEMGRSGKLK